ncbi:hypothetical protein SAMN04488030_2135 [Aliiroseovarius halocynthiae]|uniref:Uncharacterized protein n=1 Tax=Aliiroseovarius halocynthiae TaxID=985055 RepID=A0A545SKP5_9RHOB|nr:hypothetical protein [Aliiroseovarius halocynthiae]TQV65560.1 hypothetical protein FIL88_16650 [Aliiroseovarius halocynthiae]SMR81683.1 hypothetical protein SAMN04488030_2135 [Aliiroseovarius halocynthiae]
MAFRLLTLSNGHLSLEFEDADVATVSKGIKDYFGRPKVQKSILYDLLEFGGGEFIYYHEWDPCLIAQSETGNEVLRALYYNFTGDC